MTRHPRFDVRVAPAVEHVLVEAVRKRGRSMELARDIRSALRRLRENGTRANGARKLKGLELWEIRADDHRLFFCLTRNGGRVAVGALAGKTTKRFRMQKLRTIERQVHRWRDEVEDQE